VRHARQACHVRHRRLPRHLVHRHMLSITSPNCGNDARTARSGPRSARPGMAGGETGVGP
jgi:hypothetical protein